MSMLRILPDQVAEQWNVIRPAIEASMPAYIRESETRMSNILTSIMVGNMDCWVIEEGDRTAQAILLTLFTMDPAGDKSLCVYSMYGYERVTIDIWKEVVECMAKWGRANGCFSVTVYSENPKMVGALERYTVSERTSFLTQSMITIFI